MERMRVASRPRLPSLRSRGVLKCTGRPILAAAAPPTAMHCRFFAWFLYKRYSQLVGYLLARKETQCNFVN